MRPLTARENREFDVIFHLIRMYVEAMQGPMSEYSFKAWREISRALMAQSLGENDVFFEETE